MAITTYPFNKFLENQPKGVNFVDFDTDDIYVSLHTASYAPNRDTHEYFTDLTNEITGTGYTAGGQALSGKSITLDTGGDFSYFDATDVTWTGLNPATAFRYGALYKNTGTPASSPLILLIDFGTDVDPGGLDYTLIWAAPATGGILKWAGA